MAFLLLAVAGFGQGGATPADPLGGVDFPTSDSGPCLASSISYATSFHPTYNRLRLLQEDGSLKLTQPTCISRSYHREPVSGGCCSSVATDEKNCCNYEALPVRDVLVQRKLRAEAIIEYEDLADILRYAVDDSVPMVKIRKYKRCVYERLRPSKWIVTEARTTTVDKCECHGNPGSSPPHGPGQSSGGSGGTTPGGSGGGGTTPPFTALGPPPGTVWKPAFDFPDTPTPSVPGIGGSGGGSFSSYLSTPLITKCSASNDVASGTVTYSQDTRAGLLYSYLAVYDGFDPNTGAVKTKNVKYTAVKYFYARTTALAEGLACKAKESMPHDHGACAAGCSSTGATDGWIAWERDVFWDEVRETVDTGTSVIEVVMDYVPVYGNWYLLEAVSSGSTSNVCSCQTLEPPPDGEGGETEGGSEGGGEH